MAINWFKKIVKDYPKFWETYLSCFNENQSKEQRYVVFDCETTGLDYKSDRILSIGAVAIQNNKIIVADFMEVFFNKQTSKNKIKAERFIKTNKRVFTKQKSN